MTLPELEAELAKARSEINAIQNEEEPYKDGPFNAQRALLRVIEIRKRQPKTYERR